jgi:hypothetical protein
MRSRIVLSLFLLDRVQYAVQQIGISAFHWPPLEGQNDDNYTKTLQDENFNKLMGGASLERNMLGLSVPVTVLYTFSRKW